jgi:hypothetical protein
VFEPDWILLILDEAEDDLFDLWASWSNILEPEQAVIKKNNAVKIIFFIIFIFMLSNPFYVLNNFKT